jgi:uncharacterized protein YdeI (YjbR/CyaY-like superfamily)
MNITEAKFFANPGKFREWLSKHHRHEKELWVGYYKKGSGKQNMTWSESVDQALCFGWIDGIRKAIDSESYCNIRKAIDSESYCNRFTPRKPGSNWSDINIAKVKCLKSQGLMAPAGLAAFAFRKSVTAKSTVSTSVEKDFRSKLKRSKKAQQFFDAQPPHYRKNILLWISSAKKAETKAARIGKAVEASEKQKRIF